MATKDSRLHPRLPNDLSDYGEGCPFGTPVLRQFRIELPVEGPPVWRSLVVPLDVTLYKLHRIIQVAMGWQDYHLFQFNVKGFNIGEPDADYPGTWLPAKAFRLWHVLQAAPREFSYEYDFGDSWRHIVRVGKAVKPDEDTRYPLCLDGARACPPEDSGGAGGYAQLLEALADPTHPEHHDYRVWAGEDFDPEAFSVDKVNRRLKTAGLARFLRRIEW